MSLTLDFIKRVAPNNDFTATHFIEIWKHKSGKDYWIRFDETDCNPIQELDEVLADTAESLNYKTVAIFMIRLNQIPTLTKF